MRFDSVRALRNLEELSVFLSLWVLRVAFEGLPAMQQDEEVAEGKGKAALRRAERSSHGSTWASTLQLPLAVL